MFRASGIDREPEESHGMVTKSGVSRPVKRTAKPGSRAQQAQALALSIHLKLRNIIAR